jgi:hypothetical protein
LFNVVDSSWDEQIALLSCIYVPFTKLRELADR